MTVDFCEEMYPLFRILVNQRLFSMPQVIYEEASYRRYGFEYILYRMLVHEVAMNLIVVHSFLRSKRIVLVREHQRKNSSE